MCAKPKYTLEKIKNRKKVEKMSKVFFVVVERRENFFSQFRNFFSSVEILLSKNLSRFQTVYVLCVSWLFKDSNFGSPITWWRGNAKRRDGDWSPAIGCRRCRLCHRVGGGGATWWCSKGSEIFVGRTYSSLFLRFRF
jgi:hypothetical protein